MNSVSSGTVTFNHGISDIKFAVFIVSYSVSGRAGHYVGFTGIAGPGDTTLICNGIEANSQLGNVASYNNFAISISSTITINGNRETLYVILLVY